MKNVKVTLQVVKGAVRPFKTEYYYQISDRKPAAQGFPKAEIGSLAAAGRELFAQVHAYKKVRCVNRKSGKTVWEARRTRDGGVEKEVFR